MLQAGLIVAGWDSQKGGSVWGVPLGGTLLEQPFTIGLILDTDDDRARTIYRRSSRECPWSVSVELEILISQQSVRSFG